MSIRVGNAKNYGISRRRRRAWIFLYLIPAWLLPWMVICWIATAAINSVVRTGQYTDTILASLVLIGPMLLFWWLLRPLRPIGHVAFSANVAAAGSLPHLVSLETAVVWILCSYAVAIIFAALGLFSCADVPVNECWNCKYSLEGLETDRCPECGSTISGLVAPRI